MDRPAVAAVTPQYGSYVVLGELILTEETDRYDAPFEGVALRNLPQLHRQLPHGSRRPGQDHRHGLPHLVPHHRAGTARSNGPSRLDLRLRRVPEPLPLEPPRPAKHRNAAFDAVFDPLAMDAATWLGMDEAAFEALCGRTPLTRSGLTRIRENALRNAAPEEPSEC